MKILIIPDVHGRDFWMTSCEHPEKYDKIIFLGDYHDPYTFQVSQDISFTRLRDNLVPFVEANKDKVICLFGNHDGNYLADVMADRFDVRHEKEIRDYLKSMNLQLIYQVDSYLFSHSGVLPAWLNSRQLKLEDLNTMEFTHPALRDVSSYRGGYRDGSCIWGDVREYMFNEHIPNLFQIFGHTQLEREIISKDFACLDCRKAFVLDTETKELKEWNSK